MLSQHSKRTNKRRRTFSPPNTLKHDGKWERILSKWTKLTSMSPELFTKKGMKCLHFEVELSYKVVTVTVRQIVSDGINSEIYMIDFRDRGVSTQQNVILKRSLPKDDSLPTQIEAELQKWSYSKGGNAPQVLAYNEQAIISELCTSKLEYEKLPKGFDDPPTGRLNREQKRWVGTYNIALGPSSLEILKTSHRIYNNSGLYNKDPNLDNYMVLREKTVQIDYGKERFADLEHFNKWFVQLPSDIQTKDLQQILVEDNIPTYPPTFYWWKHFVYGSGSVEPHKHWYKFQWATYIKVLENKRAVFIDQLRQQYANIVGVEPLLKSQYFGHLTFLF